MPAAIFDLLLAKDGIQHRRMRLDIDEPMHPVSLGEPRYDIGSMYPRPSCDVAGHADVKRPIAAARENIDEGLSHYPWLALDARLRGHDEET
jgi:hypothetical protein